MPTTIAKITNKAINFSMEIIVSLKKNIDSKIKDMAKAYFKFTIEGNLTLVKIV